MASNITTKYDFQVMHLVPSIVFVAKAAQADYFSFTNYPGVIPLNAITFTIVNNTTSCVNDTVTYGGAKVNNASTAYTATTTSVVIDGCVGTRLPPYYVLTASGEIMYVTADSTPTTTSSTLTVRRGALGTTASATGLADNDPLYVLNQVVMDSSSVGKEVLMFYPLPTEPGAKLFSAQRES
jgi:hypothetical protein